MSRSTDLARKCLDCMKKGNETERPKKLRKRYIVIGIFLLLVAVISVMAYSVFYYFYSKMNIQPYDSVTVSPSRDTVTHDFSEPELSDTVSPSGHTVPYDPLEPELRDKVYNILLIGTDARYADQNSRSDSMIIVSINEETKKIIMTSVMRDIYCTVPGVGDTRINQAYAYGGASLLLDTVESNFGISIDDYAVINFYGFMDAVDAIGGVEIEVSAAEIKVMNSYIKELNSLLNLDSAKDQLSESDAGLLLLSGKQALAYSRVRYVGNADFERTSRQRIVLTAMMEKAKSLSLPELNELMNTVLPCVTTNLTQRRVLSLLFHANEYLNYDRDSGRIPFDGSWQNRKVRGMAVLEVDFHANKEYWRKRVYGE